MSYGPQGAKMKKIHILVSGALFCVLSSSAVLAQDKKVSTSQLDQRLQRIERILDNGVLLDMLQRIEAVQVEMRQLRGEIERLDHDIAAMSKRQRDLYLDTDRRLQGLESGAGTGTFGLGDIDLAAETDLQKDPVADSASPIAVVNTDAPELRDIPKPGEKEAYDKAYEVLIAGNNNVAIKSFEAFLKTYPSGPYSDNAWYWRGEAKYVSREFDEAVSSFNTVIADFPTSSKVPDAKLKIAYALYEQEQFEQSRKVLESLMAEHSSSSAARLAKRRLSAMNAEGQ